MCFNLWTISIVFCWFFQFFASDLRSQQTKKNPRAPPSHIGKNNQEKSPPDPKKSRMICPLLGGFFLGTRGLIWLLSGMNVIVGRLKSSELLRESFVWNRFLCCWMRLRSTLKFKQLVMGVGKVNSFCFFCLMFVSVADRFSGSNQRGYTCQEGCRCRHFDFCELINDNYIWSLNP